ncbi:unnamed protein product, partial [Meganyctiphanes norvegica]
MCRICSKIVHPKHRTDKLNPFDLKYNPFDFKINVLHLVVDVTFSIIKVGIIPSLNIGHHYIKQCKITTKPWMDMLGMLKPIQYEQDEISNDYLDVLKQPKKKENRDIPGELSALKTISSNEHTEINIENHKQVGETSDNSKKRIIQDDSSIDAKWKGDEAYSTEPVNMEHLKDNRIRENIMQSIAENSYQNLVKKENHHSHQN